MKGGMIYFESELKISAVKYITILGVSMLHYKLYYIYLFPSHKPNFASMYSVLMQ